MVFLMTIPGIVLSQSNYNQQLEKSAITLATKIKSSGKRNVAVLDFENSNKQISELGCWLSGIFTTHLENNSTSAFSVKNNTDVAKAIQQIRTESGTGAFDSRSIQRLGEISGSDVIIYAIIALMDDEITVNIKAVNPSSGSQIAVGGTIVSFTATEGMRNMYDNVIDTKSTLTGTSKSPGGTATGEGTPRKSKDPKCKEANTGDCCFQNNTKIDLYVMCHVSRIKNSPTYRPQERITLQPGQKQCFYDVQVGPMTYEINGKYNTNSYYGSRKNDNNYNAQGTVYIELCEEKIVIIR